MMAPVISAILLIIISISAASSTTTDDVATITPKYVAADVASFKHADEDVGPFKHAAQEAASIKHNASNAASYKQAAEDAIPRGQMRLAFLVTGSEKRDYEAEGRTWDDLVTTLKTETQSKLTFALSSKADFPYDMDITVTDVIEVDTELAGTWLNETGRNTFLGLLKLSQYAKEKLADKFDVVVLVFSKDDGQKYSPPFGFTLNAAACGGRFKYGNAIHLYGQIRKYTKEVFWHRLLAHEIGHTMGAYEGPRDPNDECYDLMSFSPWRIPEEHLWKKCSIERIEETRKKGDLTCLDL